MTTQLLTTEDLIMRYKVSAKTISMWKQKLALPYLSFGKEHRFDKDDLFAWERAHRRPRASIVASPTTPKRNLACGMALSDNERDSR